MDLLNASDLISSARVKSGLSQVEFAKRAGTSQPAVARYESGISSPSAATLARLLKAAGFELEVRLRKTNQSDLSTKRALKIRQKRGEIKTLVRAAGAKNVRIFGSVARGEDNAKSDIDLLVDMDLSAVENSGVKIIRLKRDLSKLLGEDVDVVPASLLKKSILESALQDAIPI